MTLPRLPAPDLPDWIATMLPRGVARYSLEVGDGQRMAVMEIGEGRPVLMVHGNPTWGFLYRKIMTALAGEPLRLIAPDLVGLGLSSKPAAEAHRLESHGRWMAELIAGLDLKDAILVGQDWGGPIGLLGVAAAPERFTGLVILNTVVSEPRPGFKPTLFHRFARMPVISDVVFRGLGFPQIGLSFAQGDRSSIRGAVAGAYRYPLRHIRDRAAPLAMARMVPDGPEHPSIPALRRCRETITELDVPIEVVWGDRDPILGGVIGWIEKLLPAARITRTGAGHFLQEEVPSEIAAAIRRISARHSLYD
jgi:haloalkane dehalogenase